MARMQLLGILGIGIGSYWLYRQSWSESLSSWFWPALSFRIAAGVGVGMLYQWYYGGQGDSFFLFTESVKLARLLRAEPFSFIRLLILDGFPKGSGLLVLGQPRALLMVKIGALVALGTGSNYWIVSAYFSLFSFWGSWQLANVLASKFQARWPAAVAFLFVPSIVWWSSGFQKESLLMGLMGGILSTWLKGKVSLKGGFWMLCAFVPMALLKYYYAALLLPVMLACQVGSWVQSFRKQVFLFGVTLAGTAWIASFIHPNLHPWYFIEALVRNHDLMLAAKPNGLIIHYHNLSPAWPSLLENVPLAFFSGIFRPMPWEVESFWQGLAALENTCWLLLFLYLLLSLIKNPLKTGYPLLVTALLVYVFFSATLLALSSPNLGTLMRYKTGYFPFLVFIVLCSLNLLHRHKGEQDENGCVSKLYPFKR
jgi:hypothetical protein